MNDLFSLTPLDIKEHAVIERWRMNNRIRQEKQCSNGKNISIKIHYDALTNQINDKVKAKQLVEKLDFAYGKTINLISHCVTLFVSCSS